MPRVTARAPEKGPAGRYFVGGEKYGNATRWRAEALFFPEQPVDLQTMMRSGASDPELGALPRAAIGYKPRRHSMGRTASFEALGHMSNIGK